ncbi:C-glycoside deglycosidase beta subunit domain-containing protein [Enterococcus sp. DIV1297f]|uniref:C-glycoside deglycosidase beta subunit domain-containing protein n=1 Tax=Enterococcus sp. DIV1297f TaxID=2774691 RepID=UPI003D2D76C7
MFEKYLVHPKGFRNVYEQQEITGFEVQLRIPYYRGLPMSCVEVIDLTIDGEKVAVKDMIITVKGESFTFDELATAINHRWEMIETITVFVKKPGGLAAGEHTIHAFVSLRISYLPFNNVGDDKKTLQLEA